VNQTYKELKEAAKAKQQADDRFRAQLLALGILMLVWVAFELVVS
jgi:CRISPR/Cas system-associated protein endoribonuclease Cas2